MSYLLLSAEHQAYDYILRHIRSGQFAAGCRLIAEEIASAIDTSRMPVREAFRRLASEGLVDIRPNRGATVRSVSIDEMREVFEMRSVLEAQAARVATPKFGRREVAELENLFGLMNKHGENAQEWVTYHREFHEYIVRLAGRKRLTGVIDSLHSVVEPHMRLWMEHTPNANDTSDHRTVLEAIRRGDPLEVESIMRDHILVTIPGLEHAMSRVATND